MTRKPTHPGEVFFKDVLDPLGVSVPSAAKMLGVSEEALLEFVDGKVALSPELAIRIAKATNTTPESWLEMQLKLTLWIAMQKEPEDVEASCLA